MWTLHLQRVPSVKPFVTTEEEFRRSVPKWVVRASDATSGTCTLSMGRRTGRGPCNLDAPIGLPLFLHPFRWVRPQHAANVV